MQFGQLKRGAFIALLCTAVIGPASAEQRGKIWRVGMLETISPTLNAANLAAFRNGLRSVGYAEGQNLVIEYRSADGDVARFPQLAAELVHGNVDLIVTRGTPAVMAAKDATTTIPIVMAASGEPLISGVIPALARPGSNITGLSAFTNELIPKRIELLNELVGQITRIGFLQDMANPVAQSQWEELRTAAQSVRIDAVLMDVRNSEDIGRAFESAETRRVDGLFVGNDAVTHANRQSIVELAAQRRLPASYATREFVDAGGLMSYAVNYADLYRRAAIYVDKIFKGAKPGELPVEQPTKFDLIINLKTARELGLTVPPTLLAIADEVLE
jgi:putative ABC transport system substrate-binding protein